ncbi:MAG TPA: M20/M25/M40 family metallo-hydrolase [Pyrinomonadaceae bacterium]|jgi:membrane-associated protease RseP (regulator of RpoE activity)
MMNKQLITFLLLLLLIFSVSGQTAVSPSETENNLRKHVSYLASDTLGGRRTGETGATSAAGYVANMFAQYKLKAGVSQIVNGKTRTNFLQSFPYVSGVELGNDNFLRIIPENPQNENKMELGVNWTPIGFSTNGYISPAPLVFAGYGISAKDLNYDDYAGLDVKDKVVLVFAGTPDSGNPHSSFSRFNLHAKAKIAQEKGAKALLIISSQTNFTEDKLAQLKYDQTIGETAIPAAAIMRSHAAELLGTKDENELAEIEKQIAKSKNAAGNSQLKSGNAQKGIVQLQVNLKKKQTAEAYNVVGILEGNDPVLKSEAIVVGAHYDHLGRGGQGSLAVNSTQIHYGADDNASGVAAMLELARQFAEAKNNKRTLIFIAFGGEEEGLLGSKAYINNPVFPLNKTVAMINLDMIGRLKDEKLIIGGVGTASEWKGLIENKSPKTNEKVITVGEENLKVKKAVEEILRKNGFNNIRVEVNQIVYLYGTYSKGKLAEIMQLSQKTSGRPISNFLWEDSYMAGNETAPFNLQLNEDGFGPSDHSSFYAQKIPVLFFFTGTHADYHKPSDTAEKINYNGLLKITNFVGEIVKSIDQNPAKPTYAVAKSSGMTGGRTGFNVSLGTVPSYAESTDGMLIDAVRDDSPAAKAGLKAGDKIIKLAGRDVRNVQDYTFVLGEMKAGEEYEVVIMRGIDKLVMKIVPAARK